MGQPISTIRPDESEQQKNTAEPSESEPEIPRGFGTIIKQREALKKYQNPNLCQSTLLIEEGYYDFGQVFRDYIKLNTKSEFDLYTLVDTYNKFTEEEYDILCHYNMSFGKYTIILNIISGRHYMEIYEKDSLVLFTSFLKDEGDSDNVLKKIEKQLPEYFYICYNMRSILIYLQKK